MNRQVDEFIADAKPFSTILQLLRTLILNCNLVEDFKWRNPCYTYNSKNVILLSVFKSYCAITFIKGELLNDSQHLLLSAGPNTKAARVIKFTSDTDVLNLSEIIKSYICEAREIEKLGIKVSHNKPIDSIFPIELEQAFNLDFSFKSAFYKLTPGRQRGYLIYFSGAKQVKTRISRIDSYKIKILDGFGLNDCICGLSKKMPVCDGAHKILNK
ncbi:DUF1801 domain-containing protein [Leeuwenhoekiella sp. W20_SRS_FM14]|uniref:YdeI/OmpD-associated family protein n=1 Tax=Leeuwenhoekiella sp. W20_SRS_FM14 TaxID=3240270 RepID=UPI003F9B9389